MGAGTLPKLVVLLMRDNRSWLGDGARVCPEVLQSIRQPPGGLYKEALCPLQPNKGSVPPTWRAPSETIVVAICQPLCPDFAAT